MLQNQGSARLKVVASPDTSSFSAACSSRAAILAKRRFGAAEADYQTHPNVFKAFNKIYHFY
jgi:hypothetical protein